MMHRQMNNTELILRTLIAMYGIIIVIGALTIDTQSLFRYFEIVVGSTMAMFTIIRGKLKWHKKDH